MGSSKEESSENKILFLNVAFQGLNYGDHLKSYPKERKGGGGPEGVFSIRGRKAHLSGLRRRTRILTLTSNS